MEVTATLSKASIYSTAQIEQSLEKALHTINSWPSWKISSMLNSDSELPQELLDKFFTDNDKLDF